MERDHRTLLRKLADRDPEAWARVSGLFAMLALPPVRNGVSTGDIARRFEVETAPDTWSTIETAKLGERVRATDVPAGIICEVTIIAMVLMPTGERTELVFGEVVGFPKWRAWQSSIVVESFLVLP